MRIVALLAIAAGLSFGQISPPPTNAPSGNAGGNLSGTYPNPTVAKINGTTVAVNSAANQVALTTAAAVTAWTGIPSCQDTVGQHLNFNTTTHAFSCGTSLPTTAVTPGSYTNTSLTVDAQGRLTAASSGAGGTPASPANSVQFNNAGAFGGSANILLYPSTTLNWPDVFLDPTTAGASFGGAVTTTPFDAARIGLLLNYGADTANADFGLLGHIATLSTNTHNLGRFGGSYQTVWHEGSGDITAIFGQGGDINNDSTGAVSNAYGTSSTVDNNGAGSIGFACAICGEVDSYGGTVSAGHALYGIVTTGGGAFTNANGLFIDTPSGTFGTLAGVRIKDQSGATGTVYNFYSEGTGANNVFDGRVGAGKFGTATNCSSAASPAVCASAAAGSVAIPTGTNPTLVVNTDKVTANSQILLQSDDTLGTKLSTTCNSTLASLAAGIVVTARTAGTSFTITFNGVLATNPLCLSYAIIN